MVLKIIRLIKEKIYWLIMYRDDESGEIIFNPLAILAAILFGIIFLAVIFTMLLSSAQAHQANHTSYVNSKLELFIYEEFGGNLSYELWQWQRSSSGRLLFSPTDLFYSQLHFWLHRQEFKHLDVNSFRNEIERGKIDIGQFIFE